MIKSNNLNLLIIFLLFIVISTQAATTSYYFYVQFANKNNSPYSLSNPSGFLSAHAIARREHRAPVYDSTDLPINPAYLLQVNNLGATIHNRSKWMNGATVLITDSSKMSQVRALSYVKSVQYTGKIDGAVAISTKKTKTSTTVNYGTATSQIDQLNGKYLHNLGYRGKDIVVGIIDAGFNNANTNIAFDSLRLQGRLLGTKDIISSNSNIFAEDSHGAMVLSTMTGNLPNQFLGTAPDASFWLIRTEYVPTEYLVETDFWCSGIEFADSVGVDVVNSSLGYTEFDDASMNFTYANMNGKVSRCSRAATLAAQKGIIVVNSAGNDGNKPWHNIGVPADAEGIVTVGGVTSTGLPSTFSSFGPSADLRIKPEICALGTAAWVVSTTGTTISGNGTSFASPIMAGMMACFLQASKSIYPPCDIPTLLNTVFESGSLYNNPSSQMGYGIPNFQLALAKLPFTSFTEITETNDVIIAYDRNEKSIHIRLLDNQIAEGKTIRLYSITGCLQMNMPLQEPETMLHTDKLFPGMYVISISGNGKTSTHKVVIR
ncbi:MAG: S8 family peptidase [Paludibacter sp.]